MESLIGALKDTPIPTILVVAGIVFLLLSIAGQLAGRITVPLERQRQATIIGCLLVVIGVTLHVIPPLLNPPKLSEAPPQITPQPAINLNEPPQLPPTPPSTQLPPPTPQPKIQDFNVVPLPSLNAQLTAIRFFESNPCEVPPLGQRAYRQSFAQMFAREIFTELTLEHPKRERRLDFTIQAFYQHEGKVIHRPELETYIRSGQPGSIYWFDKDQQRKIKIAKICDDDYTRGKWLVGSYAVDIYINGEKATRGSFEIHE